MGTITLGDIVKVTVLLWKRRVEARLTLAELAQKTGISAATLDRIESGIISPKLDYLAWIAEALNCKISDLYEVEDE